MRIALISLFVAFAGSALAQTAAEAERAAPAPGAKVERKELTAKERLGRLERFLNPNESEERTALRLDEEELAREFSHLRKAFKGTDQFKEVVALEKLWLAQRNASVRFREGRGSPTGSAGRLEGASLYER